MTDQSMFDDNNTNNSETPSQTQNDPLADLLKEIRNENGEQKYKDVATALKALGSSQQFIRQLQEEKRQVEEEKARVKAELERMGTIDDYVKRLQPNRTADEPKETPKGEGGLSVDDLDQLLEQRLTVREQQARKAANLQQVESQVAETYGDKAAEFIKQRAQELSMPIAELKELAMKSPSAALRLLDMSKKNTPAPTHSSVFPPRQPTDDNPIPKFDRSVVHGGMTNEELVERWKQAKAYTHKRLNVESK